MASLAMHDTKNRYLLSSEFLDLVAHSVPVLSAGSVTPLFCTPCIVPRDILVNVVSNRGLLYVHVSTRAHCLGFSGGPSFVTIITSNGPLSALPRRKYDHFVGLEDDLKARFLSSSSILLVSGVDAPENAV